MHVAIAVHLYANAQILEAGDGVFGPEFPHAGLGGRFGAVDLQPDQYFLQVVVAQTISIVQLRIGLIGGELQMVRAHLADPADGLPRVLGRIEGADVFLAALHEIIRELAVEVLVRVGRKAEAAVPAGTTGQLGAFFQNLVEQQAIVRRDVLDVGHVLVAAFDFEATDARINECAQIVALVIVFHRQYVFVVSDDATLRVFDFIGQAAGLRAVATVGAAPGMRMADVAEPAVGHTEGAVNEEFESGTARCITRTQCGIDGGHLLKGQFARQYDLREAAVLQETGFLGRADVGLRAGMQLNRRQIDFQQTHVLNNQCIDARIVELPGQLAGGLQFVVAQNGVERDEDAAVEAVRIVGQPGNVLHAVVGGSTGTERGAADVNGVGTMNHGFDTDVGIAGGGKKL